MLRLPALTFMLALSATGAPYSALYFFGDSLTDTGNLHHTSTLANMGSGGAIPVTPATPPYFYARYSNGFLWSETFAERMGMVQDAEPAGMYLGSLGYTVRPGHNYAIGGAGVGFAGEMPDIPTGIQAQAQYYLSRNSYAADPDALYVIMGGATNIRRMATVTDPEQRQAIASAQALSFTLQDLYAAGARNFVLFNAFNIGVTPEAFIRGITESATSATLAFNHTLDLYRQAYQAAPDVNLIYIDLFDYFNDVLDDALSGGAVYGFTTLGPCIGSGDCSTSLFFDQAHFTARFHEMLGNFVADQVPAGTLSFGAESSSLRMLQFDSVDTQTPEPSTAIAGAAILLLIALRMRHRQGGRA